MTKTLIILIKCILKLCILKVLLASTYEHYKNNSLRFLLNFITEQKLLFQRFLSTYAGAYSRISSEEGDRETRIKTSLTHVSPEVLHFSGSLTGAKFMNPKSL